MQFDLDVSPERIAIRPQAPSGLLARLRKSKAADLTAADPGDRALAFALAELTLIAEDRPGEIAIEPSEVRLSHAAAAGLDGATAAAIGLPPLPDLLFSTDVEGVIGRDDFRLAYRWTRDGAREPVRRTGAILHTSTGDRRLPSSILGAIEIAEAGRAASLEEQWNALARFRRALLADEEDEVGRVAMTDFLAGLDVHLAGGFSVEPKPGKDGLDFEVVAHDGSGVEAQPMNVDAASVAEGVRRRGALPAYRLARGSYLVVDGRARPVLEVMAAKQRAPVAEREAFVRNPWPDITAAIEADLERRGTLDGLGDADRQEEIERASAPFVEVEGYAERVRGVEVYRAQPRDPNRGGTTWLPEIFGEGSAEAVEGMSDLEVEELSRRLAAAVEDGETVFEIAGRRVPIDVTAVAALDAERERRRAAREEVETVVAPEDAAEGPRILATDDNVEEVGFLADVVPRRGGNEDAPPALLRTSLHPHQAEGLDWAREAWRAGLPGILNADEQGLGKTLQTIAFLAWLQERMEASGGAERGPILVVAPTSLLRTWEEEVRRHLDQPGLGALIRLYGSGLAAFRTGPGRETDDAEERLDLGLLRAAMAEGRAHRMWLLTTYQTLTSHQHSLGRIRFAALVFDEIQALKNPGSLAAKAGMAMNADFRIGLTGTPVENAVVDLWAIMEQLAAGALGSRRDFTARYGGAEPEALGNLHRRVFDGSDRHPLVLRRVKEDAAAYLPAKTRLLHPRAMPPGQAVLYEDARTKLGSGGLKGALRALHRIRGVSLHPAPDAIDGFEGASARLMATMDVLRDAARRGEKALVFIEDRKVQARFTALAREAFGLSRVDVINGGTPVARRQEIVERFQRGFGQPGFDVLVLGPKAAGTGLTLTAATHVVHLSRWWNPAVEEQCNDRVHRIGQNRPVTIHVPMAVHPRYGPASFDCHLHGLMERKRRLARGTLMPVGDSPDDVAALRDGLASDDVREGTPIAAVQDLYRAIGMALPEMREDGTLVVA